MQYVVVDRKLGDFLVVKVIEDIRVNDLGGLLLPAERCGRGCEQHQQDQNVKAKAFHFTFQ